MGIFIKYIKATLSSNRNIYDSIGIVVVFDFIYKNFNTKTSNLLKIGYKKINKI